MEVLTTIETTKPCNASKLVYTEDKTKHEAPTRREGKVRDLKLAWFRHANPHVPIQGSYI